MVPSSEARAQAFAGEAMRKVARVRGIEFVYEEARRALSDGMEPIADAMLPKLLAPATRERRPDLVARVREMILGTRPEGAAAALRGMAVRRDQTDLLPGIGVPTLIVVGGEDAIT